MFWFVIVVIILLVLILFVLNNKSRPSNLPVVQNVDLSKYMGHWYEIARLPNNFEQDCINAEAMYILNNDNSVRIINSCIRNGMRTEVKGLAKPAPNVKIIPKTSIITQGRLLVSFNGPIAGEYNIIALTNDYKHAMVAGSDNNYLWILSRTKNMDPDILRYMINFASKNNFDTSKLIFN